MSAKFRPFDDLESPNKRRRNLPHWETCGATYYITFRLADASSPLAKDYRVKWRVDGGSSEMNDLGSSPIASACSPASPAAARSS